MTKVRVLGDYGVKWYQLTCVQQVPQRDLPLKVLACHCGSTRLLVLVHLAKQPDTSSRAYPRGGAAAGGCALQQVPGGITWQRVNCMQDNITGASQWIPVTC